MPDPWDAARAEWQAERDLDTSEQKAEERTLDERAQAAGQRRRDMHEARKLLGHGTPDEVVSSYADQMAEARERGRRRAISHLARDRHLTQAEADFVAASDVPIGEAPQALDAILRERGT